MQGHPLQTFYTNVNRRNLLQQRNSLIAALSASFAAMLLSFMIHSPWSVPNIYSDIGSFWGRTVQQGLVTYYPVQQGWVPYFQFFFEYPPISGYILYLARIVGSDYNGYYSAFGVMSLVAALGLAWSCWRVTKALGTRLNPLYFFLPSVIIYGVYNFDLFNALFIILSLQFFLEDRKGASAAALGLSIATKLVGGVLLPIYLLELRNNRLRLRYLLITAAVVAFFYLPIALLNFKDLSQFYTYYRNWGLEDAWYVWIFQNPSSAYAKWFGLAVTAILLLRVYTLKVSLVPRIFLGLAAYLFGASIYSPQFNLMLIPLVVVLSIDDPSLYAWEVFNALIILTWFLVSNPTWPWTLPQTMALLRTGSLAWLCLALLHKSGIRPVELLPSFLRRPSLLDASPRRPQVEDWHGG
jgi:hypothetical protein